MNKTYQASLSLVLPSQECQKCHQTSSQSHSAFNNIWFYCQKCEIYTKWNHGTILQTSNLSPSHIDVLLEMFLTNKTPSDALDILAYSFVNQSLNITTIRRYFLIFCNVVLDYYEEQMSYILLENDVEIDETHLFREKKSSAPHRPYKLSSVWLFGAKQRNSKKFILIPLKDRKEDRLISIIRKHVKLGSNIYSDSFSVYVNNHRKESKLQR